MHTVTNNPNSTQSNGHTPKPIIAPIVALPVAGTSAASNNPEAVPAAGGAHRTGDLITRSRDKFGNRLPWFYAHSVPAVEDVPLRETALVGAVEEVREQYPIAAAEMEHYYEHKLRPSLRRLIAIRDAEEGRIAAHNVKAGIVGEALDIETARVNQVDLGSVAELETRLTEAHLEAGHKVAGVGGDYDPESPDSDAAVRVVVQDDRAIASRHNLPWTPADKTVTLHPLFGWAIAVIIGMAIGLSLGIMSGYVPAGNWLGKPLGFSMFQAFGIAVALISKMAIRLSAREASQRYWLRRCAVEWGFFAVVSTVVSIAIFVIDSLVEREGIMANVRMQDLARSLSGQLQPGETGAKEWLYFLMAIVLTFAYVVYSFWEGYLSGRYDACINRIKEEQARIFREEDTTRRSLTGVQEALHALATVRKLRHEKMLLETRIAERTARLDAGRLSEITELPEDARQRIQDALDQVNGTQAIFDAMFADAKFRCEGGSKWQSIIRIIRGAPRRRQRQREQRRMVG